MVNLIEKDASYTYLKCDDFSTLEKITLCLRARYSNYIFMPQYKKGDFDGYRNFYKRIDDNTLLVPRNCIELVLKHLKVPFNNIMERNQVSLESFKDFISTLNLPFHPYDYQIEAGIDCINNKSQISLMATGSGKSLTIYLIIRWILVNHPNYKVLLLVPNISLLTQMENDFLAYGWSNLDKHIKKIGGKYRDKDINTFLTISTWQSIKNNVDKLKNIDVLIEDEVHRASSNVHYNLIFPKCVNAYYRLGFTGTIDDKDKLKKLAIMATFGGIKKYITTPELIKRKLATNLEIQAITLSYSDEMREIIRYMDYNREISTIINYKPRILYLAELIKNIKGNTIVLFNTIEHGIKLVSAVTGEPFSEDLRIYNKHKNIFFLSGDSKADDRENIRLGMEEKNNCVIFGTASIMSTGINIKNLHNIVFVGGGKSFIGINQSIGRVIRLHESKDIVKIYDIIDDLRYIGKENYLYRHAKERIKLYRENGYRINGINKSII